MTTDQPVALRAGFDLRVTPSAPSVARRLVAELLRAWEIVMDVLADATLLVSELVSNAVEHAGGELTRVELTLARADGVLRVLVSDGSRLRPTVVPVNGHGPRGRGVFLVDALSSRWGVEDRPGGKSVWCEIALTG